MKIELNQKIFWFVAFLFIALNVFITYTSYQNNQTVIKKRAINRAQTIQSYINAVKDVYNHRFIKSNLDINDSTIGFLPAYSFEEINQKFSSILNDGTQIREVVYKPKHLKNLPNKDDLKAIEYFLKYREDEYFVKEIEHNYQKYISYQTPIVVEKSCLTCHGKKDEISLSFKHLYNENYIYEIGDIIGITNIIIPLDYIAQQTIDMYFKYTITRWIMVFIILLIVYIAIKRLTIKDIKQKESLKEDISKKTEALERQKNELIAINKNQEHLFLTLKTIAECNKILITAKTIDELIQNTAVTIHSNSAFISVRISLFEDGKLKLKSSIGIVEENDEILPLERDIFENNRFSVLKNFETLDKKCIDRAKKYNFTEIYALPLRKEHYAQDALGTMIICTAHANGFTHEERGMIDELAGDIGFAINSFHQKDIIKRLSFYDTLTNLPNQNLFEQYLHQAFINSENKNEYGAVLFVDIDNFNDVNNVLGKEACDFILKELSNRLITSLNDTTLISRYRSDQFLILIESLSKNEDEAAIASQHYAQIVSELIKEPFILKSQKFYLTLSIGIVIFFNHTKTSSELLNEAEYATKTAKEEGGNGIKFFNASLQEITKSKTKIVQSIKMGLEANELFVLYQPQVDENKKVVGVEALIRWKGNDGEVISPSSFIPLAEESGVIKDIGKFILNEAIKQLLIWSSDEIKKEWKISVNVSPLQFREDNFVQNIKDLLQKYGFNPNLLRFELTEGILIGDKDSAMQKINDLSELGFSISIDDFGTGYSSLGYLKHLKIDELKIDQSFVFGLKEGSSSDKTIIKTIVMMGEEFGFEVIAEGVETQEQFEELKSLGCKYFQGYLFSKPIEAKML